VLCHSIIGAASPIFHFCCAIRIMVWFFFVSRSFSPFFDLRLSKVECNKCFERWQRGARGKRRGFSPGFDAIFFCVGGNFSLFFSALRLPLSFLRLAAAASRKTGKISAKKQFFVVCRQFQFRWGARKAEGLQPRSRRAPLAARLSAYAILPKTPLFGPKHLFFLTFASSAYFQTNFGEFSRLNSKTAQEKSRTLRVQFSPKFSNHSPFFRLAVAASQI